MTPKERRDIEYAHEKLLDLYRSGNIRPAEMGELRNLTKTLQPMWQQEQDDAQPAFRAREASVRRGSDRLDMPSNMKILACFSGRGATSEAGKLAGLLKFVPVPGTVMSAMQAPRDARSGDYGSAALNAATLPLDMMGLGSVRRGVSSVKGLLAK
jgi:hypothetical protein